MWDRLCGKFLKLFFFFVVTIFDLVHDVEAFTAMSDDRETANLQFHEHHSYFKKDFQMLVAVKEDKI